ncbi:MAG: MAPEG family protein [Deltaproteobacteria bacterium]|nr:MAPEG family protein [Deltaproteobacteria bacterium]
MTTPFWCLLFAAVFPYVITGLGVKYRIDQLGSVDKHHPREQAKELRDVAARADAAQQNAWEALAVFTAAVTVAHLSSADPDASATASLVFVLARILHPIAYIANQPTLRALAFLTGLLSCLTLFGLAIGA